MSTVNIQYFSDVLCAWAYVGQARLNELESRFGDEVDTDCHFMTVFGDARGKLEASWKERGGLAGYAEHVRDVIARFDHVDIHPDAWEKVAPNSSLNCHIFLAAVKLHDAEMFRKAAWALRLAFFRDAVDISSRKAQLEVAEQLGLSAPKIETLLYNGKAHAELSRGLNLAKLYSVNVSPTFVFNEGRQRLQGNVGYRVVEANVTELLRQPEESQSWC